MNKEIRKQRLEACLDCDRLFRPTYTCKECGCFVKIKSAIGSMSCPLGKWPMPEESK